MMSQLAVNLSMIFTEVPLIERFARRANMAFSTSKFSFRMSCLLSKFRHSCMITNSIYV